MRSRPDPESAWIGAYEYTAIAMGVFDSPTGRHLARHTFVGEKADYYEIADGVFQSESY